jgi:4-diphosphocytidyl-2-C-methyl-D-erythritol kinase
MPITVRSFAKINWMLRVLGRRSDGYHELETLFQTISLHDVLHFERAEKLSVRCSDQTIPSDERNLVYRAAKLMADRFDVAPFAIGIDKRIPAGGGLGGGSSNAATTLLVLRATAPDEVSDDQLRKAALELGSDVPFFLVGGLAYGGGRGEELTPLEDQESIELLLLFPAQRVSTVEAFKDLDARRGAEASFSRELNASIGSDRLLRYAMHVGNDLELAVFVRLPHLSRLRDRLSHAGASWARMTGSGSTIVGAFTSTELRDQAAAELGREGIHAVPARTVGRDEALADVQGLGRIR